MRSIPAPKPTSPAGQGRARASKAETNLNSVTQDEAASGPQAHVALRQLAKLLGRLQAREFSREEGCDD